MKNANKFIKYYSEHPEATIPEIGNAVGVSQATAYRYANKLNLRKKSRRKIVPTKEFIASYYAGVPVKRIAIEYNISNSTAHKLVRELKLKRVTKANRLAYINTPIKLLQVLKQLQQYKTFNSGTRSYIQLVDGTLQNKAHITEDTLDIWHYIELLSIALAQYITETLTQYTLNKINEIPGLVHDIYHLNNSFVTGNIEEVLIIYNFIYTNVTKEDLLNITPLIEQGKEFLNVPKNNNYII